jgi:aminopeptidase N
VETKDLQAAIREATGSSMDRFFDQWIYGPGHPVFDVRWEWIEESRKVRLRVRQTQTPLFETPVEIGIVTDAGKSVERLNIAAAAGQVFEIACAARPRMVRFDQGDHLLMELKFDKSVEELLYQLANDDAMGRMWAASQLKGKGADAALRKAAAEDPFAGVRRAAADALRN